MQHVYDALALLGFSFVPSFWFMVPLAIVLGLGAGAIDSGLNNYVALHFKASHMNFLHCFYGVGVSLSPYLMSQALSGIGWRGGYRYAFYVQLAIAILLIVSLPMWKKTSSGEQAEEEKGVNLSIFQMAKRADVRLVWVIMLATNAIEYACGGIVSYSLSDVKPVLQVEGKGLRAMHRKAENEDIFILFSESEENTDFRVHLPSENGYFLDAESGELQKLKAENGVLDMSLVTGETAVILLTDEKFDARNKKDFNCSFDISGEFIFSKETELICDEDGFKNISHSHKALPISLVDWQILSEALTREAVLTRRCLPFPKKRQAMRVK